MSHVLYFIVLTLRKNHIGKTNHGTTKLYGRAIRAKDVRACGMGAYAFYLVVRFYMTEEYKTIPDDYFCENSTWFDTKLLVDCYADDYSKQMSNDSYSKFMKRILTEQNIASNHIVHLGRILGSADLELLENEKDGTLDMGNWSSDVHKRSYSIKMPIKSLRRAAGFVLAEGMHHNIRTTVEPDPEDADLLDLPFPFVKRCMKAVLAAKEAATNGSQSYLNTAVCFLELLEELALVFLQDAAAMLVLHPERGDNAMFAHIPLLKTEMFKRFVEKMRLSLDNSENPTDYKLEAALPGVQQRFQSLEGHMGSMQRKMGTMETNVVTAVRDEGQKMRELIAHGFEEAATAFRGGGGSRGAAGEQQILTRTSTMVEASVGGLAFSQLQFYGNHKSVRSMYNEYYGKGEFNLIPMLGGLFAMETKFGAKWRKHIPGGSKFIGRVKAVMGAINSMAGTDGGSVDGSIDKLELVFQAKDGGNKSLSKLVDILKQQGIVAVAASRGPRGRGVGIG
jgi:hypothetical protein